MIHHGQELTGFTPALVNQDTGRTLRPGRGHWTTRLQQEYMFCGEATVVLEVRRRTEAHDSHTSATKLHLTTGEARVLAAQLIRHADAEDLSDL